MRAGQVCLPKTPVRWHHMFEIGDSTHWWVFTYPGHGGSADTARGAAADQAEALNRAVSSLGDHGIEAGVVSAGSTPTAQFSTN